MAVLSEPLHPSMGRLLLIKPESFLDEVIDGLLRKGQSQQITSHAVAAIMKMPTFLKTSAILPPILVSNVY